MTETMIRIEGGEVLANLATRTITGRLLPFNEEGRTNLGRMTVEAGSIAVPTDPMVVSLNLDHERSSNVARSVALEQRADGVYATFQFANTPEGDAALADALSPTGKRRKLSAEFGPAMVKAGKLVAGTASLWGAALVEAGAFPSAMVLATDTPEEPPATGEHIAVAVETLPADITATTPAGESAVYTPEAAPAPANPEGGSTVTATAVTTAPASVPVTMPGVPVLASGALTTPRPVDLQQVFAAVADYRTNPDNREAHDVLAALTSVTIGGTNALPAADVLRPNWVGQMYQGIPYEREYIGLGNLGTDITAGGKKGFKVKRGTAETPIAGSSGIPNGGTWAGNKTEINSYNGFTQTGQSFRRQFAVGHDIAREFYDLPGGSETVEAFLKLVIEDHLVWSDNWALFDLLNNAAAPVAPKTYPTDYPKALGMIIQGILGVKKRKPDGRRDVPTYAIANDEAYEQLVYAAGGAEHLPEFVKIAISTNSEGTVDGNVQVVQGDTGITGSESVQVGSKKAVEFDELAGGPLIINALELAKGGIDRAVHGYLQTFPVRPEANVLIGTPASRGNEADYPLGRVVKTTGSVYRVVAAGKTGAAAPTAPTVGDTVTDGTATLLRIA